MYIIFLRAFGGSIMLLHVVLYQFFHLADGGLEKWKYPVQYLCLVYVGLLNWFCLLVGWVLQYVDPMWDPPFKRGVLELWW